MTTIKQQKPVQFGRRTLVRRGLTGAGLTAITVWHKPVIDSLILPAHAQATVASALSVALGAVRSGESLSGSIDGAIPGETVEVVISDPASAASLTITVTANDNGEANFSVSAAKLASSGLAARSGAKLNVGAKADSGRSGTTASVVQDAASSELKLTLASASSDSGISGSLSGAKAGERVAVTLTEKSSGAVFSANLKADAKGNVSIDANASALKSAGFSMKDGAVVEAAARSASGKTAKASISIRGSVAPAKLTATLSADASAGANGNVFGAAPSEAVTVTLMDESTGKSLDIKVKADSSGTARFSASAASLKSAGFALKNGSTVTAVARSTSGREGSASAVVTGTVETEAKMSASLSATTGGSISISNAKAGDGFGVTLTEAATGATLSLKAKASERGDAKVAISVDQLKKAGFSMKAGSEVSIVAKASSGSETKIATKFA